MADYFSVAFEAMNRALSQHAGFFQSEGVALMRSFAIILLVLSGLMGALSSAEGGPGFSISRLMTLLIQIAIVNIMVTFYTAPIPGIGESFPHLILNSCQWMMAQLSYGKLQDLIQTLDVVQTNIPFPSPYVSRTRTLSNTQAPS